MYYCLDEFFSRIFSCLPCQRLSVVSQHCFLAKRNHLPQQRPKLPNACFPRLLCSKGMWPSPGQWGLRGSLNKEGHLFLLGNILLPVKLEMCEKDLRWEMFSHFMIMRWWPTEADTVEPTLKQYTSVEVYNWLKWEKRSTYFLYHFWPGILLLAAKNIINDIRA